MLKKRNQKIEIDTGYRIGIQTADTTIDYSRYAEVDQILQDSIVLRVPVATRDTLLPLVGGDFPRPSRHRYFYLGIQKLSGKRFARVKIVDSYTQFAADCRTVVSLQIPPKINETTGCIFCIFLLLVPIINIFFIRSMRQRWVPKRFYLKKWLLLVAKERLVLDTSSLRENF